jgi:hypothetical protein
MILTSDGMGLLKTKKGAVKVGDIINTNGTYEVIDKYAGHFDNWGEYFDVWFTRVLGKLEVAMIKAIKKRENE